MNKEEIEKLLKDNEVLQDMDKILRNENTNLKLEIKRLNNIINKAIEYVESYINQFNGVYPTADMRYLDLHKLLGILKGSDKE